MGKKKYLEKIPLFCQGNFKNIPKIQAKILLNSVLKIEDIIPYFEDKSICCISLTIILSELLKSTASHASLNYFINVADTYREDKV